MQRFPQRAVILTNHVETLLRLALEGAGITVVSQLLAKPYVDSGELRRVLPQWQAGTITIYVALPSRKYVPAHARAFLNFLQQYRERAVTTRMRYTTK